MLSGCDLTNDKSVNAMLRKMSSFNDDAQALLFDPNKLAPTYPESMITRPFPFNAFYDIDEVPRGRCFDVSACRSVVWSRQARLDAGELRAAAREPGDATYLHRRMERDRQMGRRALRRFPARVGADTTAKYVAFRCADNYSTSIDMPTALHAQTLLTLTYDGQVLPPNMASR